MLDQIRSMPRPFWVLFGGSFINRFGNFVMPMLAIYLTRQGHSIARAGLVAGDATTSALSGVSALSPLPQGVRAAGRRGAAGKGSRPPPRDPPLLLRPGEPIRRGVVPFRPPSTLAIPVKSLGYAGSH